MLFYVVKYSFLVLWLVKLQTGTKFLYLLQSNLLPQVLRHFYTKNVVQYSMGYLSLDLSPQFCSLCIYFLIVSQPLQLLQSQQYYVWFHFKKKNLLTLTKDLNNCCWEKFETYFEIIEQKGLQIGLDLIVEFSLSL